ncbi:MAG TPA: isoprenylcysteine carboxylmethyltransferase family protein [Candidatus Saccharimonadia bacterium]|nr:isoprenylcysteine carboxylmethyltransferase family protein [Candidatus Saccharimonadia bacterium]
MQLLSEGIGITWALFWLYWLFSAFGSKKNLHRNLSQSTGIRLILFVLIVIIARKSLNGHGFSADLGVANHIFLVIVLGLVLFVAGLFLAVWARINIGKNWGMPMSEKQEPELVTSGPYRFVRHPIYTGVLSAMLGTALAANYFWLIIFVGMAAYFIFSATREEKLLTKQFPETYPNYVKESKMLIPFVF